MCTETEQVNRLVLRSPPALTLSSFNVTNVCERVCHMLVWYEIIHAHATSVVNENRPVVTRNRNGNFTACKAESMGGGADVVVFRTPSGVSLLCTMVRLWLDECWMGFVWNFPQKSFDALARLWGWLLGGRRPSHCMLGWTVLSSGPWESSENAKIKNPVGYSAFTVAASF